MKTNFISKKTLFIALTALTIASCSDEDENLTPIEDTSSEIQTTQENNPFLKGAFVFNEKGERIPEDEFLRQNGLLDEPSNYVTASRADLREEFYISRTDMDRNGMSFGATSSVMNRYKAHNRHDPGYRNINRAGWNVIGLLVNCRPYGNSKVCTSGPGGSADRNYAKWVLTRTAQPIYQATQRISGPSILTSVEKKGWRNSPRRLGTQKLYEFKEKNESAVTRTTTATVTYGVKVGMKMSAGFFGTGSEFSTEFSFGGSLSTANANSVTKGTERSTTINFDDGDVVPKNQTCDFVLYGEQRRVTKRYQVKLGIKGGNVLVKMRSGNRTSDALHTNAAAAAFPDAIRQGKVKNNFDVTSTYWRYSIRRENCKRLR
ncbi:hypothetical protein [uncultured Tenacibaculum sp.]|uniref:hypothetical protein n=1 Tax=uncultured Tenacibaculum sp. TaxID=174713 RepID=UPI002624E985|nr:hypothetical protein [uncultured Tenacibaculum sp.]